MLNCLSWTLQHHKPTNQYKLSFLGRDHQFPIITHTVWAIITELKKPGSDICIILLYFYFTPYFFSSVLFLPLLLLFLYPHFLSIHIFLFYCYYLIHIFRWGEGGSMVSMLIVRLCFVVNTWLAVESCALVLTNRLRLHTAIPAAHSNNQSHLADSSRSPSPTLFSSHNISAAFSLHSRLVQTSHKVLWELLSLKPPSLRNISKHVFNIISLSLYTRCIVIDNSCLLLS